MIYQHGKEKKPCEYELVDGRELKNLFEESLAVIATV